MLDLGIVIVNYNTRDLLGDCLQSLPEACRGLRQRTIVVDNNSSDGSAAFVRTAFPAVTLLEPGRNGGYAFANNIGLRALGFGDGVEEPPRYVLLLNPDTVVPPDGLTRMVAFLDANPDVGVVGPKLVRQDGAFDRACRRSFPTPEVSFYRLTGLSRLFPRSRRFGRYNLSYLSVDEQADVDAVVGAFMLMRREALQGAGLLDETFFMYGEDLDLCYRIKALGWRVVYNPSVVVLHIKGAASRQASRRSIEAFYDAMRIFHDKHYRAQHTLVVNGLVDLGIGLMRAVALLRDRLRPKGRKRVASA
ncbi:MAG TPA: glycosyltransferase family 2 protein [Chloroflexi bacterium]|nr:glycosyltransferase family 2 protein [Chloroflexota bacterium]